MSDFDLGNQLLKEQRGLKAVSLTEILAMEFPPRENILYPWLPSQGLAMLYGTRGTGKTHVALGIAVAVASGGSFLKWTAPKPRGVLLLDGEMPAVTLQERLSAIICSSDKEPVSPLTIITPDLQKEGMPNLAHSDDQENIEEHLKNISLVIVDNLSTLCRYGRENEGESWLPVQEWALRLRTMGISVLFIHHAGKGGQQRGTSRKEDVLDTVIALKRPADYRPDEGARFEVYFEKARGIYGDEVKPFEARLTTTPEGAQIWTMKDLEDSLTERIAEMLNEGIPQSEIPEFLGVGKATVSRHKQKARNEDY
ncbi:MAG: AAA family ATPase [Thermodesulfovibrionales bacterium]